jgi:hypothetical protein
MPHPTSRTNFPAKSSERKTGAASKIIAGNPAHITIQLRPRVHMPLKSKTASVLLRVDKAYASVYQRVLPAAGLASQSVVLWLDLHPASQATQGRQHFLS